MYQAVKLFLRVALGFYFRHIERFHSSRVPGKGPVLFVSNHPNSLTDSFVIGASVHRKVNFVATAQLFRFGPIKWLLSQCGVIPINRVADNPRGMRSVTDTFESCYRVLERGEAVGIFPEGVTYDDSQLKEVKSGAARMALELEHRHSGKLGLQVVPAGLTYSAKELYRSDVLVNFGEPICVSDFLGGYEERRKECLNRLTAEIRTRLESLIVSLSSVEEERRVAIIRQLYLARMERKERTLDGAETLALTQKIAEVIDWMRRNDSDRAARFMERLDLYQRMLRRAKIDERTVTFSASKRHITGRGLARGLVGVLAFPVAAYGWVHRLAPFALVRWARGRLPQAGRKKAQASTVSIQAGIVAFGFFYGIYILAFHYWFGWPASLWYALSLPAASLAAHYYVREIKRMRTGGRNLWMVVTAPTTAQRIVELRNELMTEIETVEVEVRTGAMHGHAGEQRSAAESIPAAATSSKAV